MNPIYKKKNSSILNAFFNSTVFILMYWFSVLALNTYDWYKI